MPLLPAPRPAELPVRPARPADAAALAALSRPFARTGALRERPEAVYAAHATDFMVWEAPDGTLDGCLGLQVYGADQAAGGPLPAGVLYNFCVTRRMQGQGVGALLLRAALTRANALSLTGLFTATTGSGALFLRYGFTPADASLAPEPWAGTLDPRRNARVLARRLRA
ncbi:amino acid acetyltransferase [Streptomyces venezuelae]|uniref:Amino acid acetyltransferase n=1 Tax=Streptomyces venezuelae TaxID=54571 RepID=A0A5P2D9U3_STRVZ|nr:GNAT family N-acetyltransferase [Streptomyces venezuelae]QES51330.1 amino acid acetyltransferase [Streptomyces venezuelae]